MANPQEESADDEKCIHCGINLTEIPPGQGNYNGACGPSCYLHHVLTLAGVNGAISGLDAVMGRAAIKELENGHAK